jgi:5-methylthioadenosine/S-adenosylhomocysteine deaminase
VAPAFTNAHTHLAMHALRGVGGDDARRGNVVEDLWFGLEANLQPGDVRAFARLGALECLLSGTGAVFDHYYASLEVAEALRDVGLEGVVAPTLQDLGGPGATAWAAGLETTERVADDASLAERGIVAALGPHATDTVSDVLWARISEVARRRGLPVHVHLAQSAEEVERARAEGYGSPVERLVARGRLVGVARTLVVHAIYVRDEDLDLLDRERDIVVHCPASQLQFAFPADIGRWQDAGYAVALGTDAGASNDAMNVQRELLLLGHGSSYAHTFRPFALRPDLAEAAVLHDRARARDLERRLVRVDPGRVLESVWGVPGSFHPALPVGRVAVGYRANLAAWDLDHPSLWPAEDPLRGLAFGDPARALRALWVGGRLIGKVGEVSAVLRRPEVASWIREASERRAALLQRAGRG